MAHLVKQKKTYHVGPDGKRCPKDAPGAKKVTEESSKWYAAGVPGWPKGKRVPLATRKEVAQRMLADLVANAERGQAHMPAADLNRAKLPELLAGYEEDLRHGLASKTRSAKRRPSDGQVRQSVQRVRDLLAGCGFVSVSDLNDAAPAKLAKYLAGRAARPRKQGGFSAQSGEFFRKSAKRFVWWLSVRKRAPVRADLFDDVPGFDAKHNRVHARRHCPPAELAQLLDATRAAEGDYRGLTGEDRYHLYLTAFASGFRAGELAVLTPTHFDLAATPPAVTLTAAETKNKKPARNPLPAGVAAQLRKYLSTRPPGVVWSGTWAEKPAKMLKADLKRAGIPYRVDAQDGPRYLDFHALRHSFVSALAAAGVGPKELQTLARHSDPQLTLSVYTHAGTDALAAAVDRLQLPGGEVAANPLASLSRAELEEAVVGLLGVVGTLLGQAAVPTLPTT